MCAVFFYRSKTSSTDYQVHVSLRMKSSTKVHQVCMSLNRFSCLEILWIQICLFYVKALQHYHNYYHKNPSSTVVWYALIFVIYNAWWGKLTLRLAQWISVVSRVDIFHKRKMPRITVIKSWVDECQTLVYMLFCKVLTERNQMPLASTNNRRITMTMTMTIK